MSELWIPNKYRPKQVEKQTFVWFENRQRHIIIPPVIDGPVPSGFQKFELPLSHVKDVEKVSLRFQEQKKRIFDQMDEKTIERVEARMKEIRTSLTETAKNTKNQYEKDLIRHALKQIENDEHKLKERKREFHLHIEGYEAPTK